MILTVVYISPTYYVLSPPTMLEFLFLPSVWIAELSPADLPVYWIWFSGAVNSGVIFYACGVARYV